MSPSGPAESSSPPRMQCMQVWGGNRAADESISTTGLDVWLYSRPHGDDDAGGDVYYLSSCSSGRITRLVLADVAGHGSGVVDFSNALRRLMRRHINRVNQTRLVEALNKGFVSVGGASMFATALIGTFFVPTRTLTLTNAGHLSPLMFDGEKREWRVVGYSQPAAKPTDVALGIFDGTEYEQVSMRMKAGDLVLWFTDGLSECVDEAGEMLGPDGIATILAGMTDLPAEDLVPRLLGRIGEMSETNLSEDDLTLLLFCPNGASVSLKDNLLAPFRMAGQLLGRDT